MAARRLPGRTAMQCPDDDGILAFFEGTLAADAAEAIERHLDACPACRVLFSRIARAATDDPSVPAAQVPTEILPEPPAPAPVADLELPPGSSVAHYQILRLLGRGGMGEVYLARDTRLGRKVALKMVRPGVLGSPAARDRFLFEARTTARFNHPHIVTIHDVGEDRGRPYLALEYLRGESLRQRLARERPATLEAIRIAAAIAEALAEAHRHGVLHRDLKPENVFLSGDGRLRVLDFGLAKALGAERRAEPVTPSAGAWASSIFASMPTQISLHGTEGLCGSPAYMAPEQWAGKECAATDLWALGVILHELTTGELPYRAASAAELASQVCSPDPAPRVDPRCAPAGLIALIAACLSKSPAERPDAAETIARLRELLAREPAVPETTPFRGLLPFDEEHRHLFFGRETEIARVVDRLRETPAVPVLGTSGAGKSSFVAAGLIPRLRERGPLTVLQLRPGPRPFLALAAKIVGARDRPSGPGGRSPFHPAGDSPAAPGPPGSSREPGAAALAAALRASPPLLGLTLQRLAESLHTGVLLFVDQLEELYTLVSDPEEQQRFAEALCGAADDPSSPVRLVVTLRQEFLSRLAECPESRAVLDGITVLRPPGPAMLAEALTRPLEAVGYRYDDARLVDEMVDAVRGEPASLSLLQFALEQLWELRDREARLLRRSAYAAIGGVAGALAHHADGVLDELPPPALALARVVLLRLVTPDRTRRVLPRAQLLDGLDAEAGEVLARLAAARLLTVRQATPADPPGEVLVELAHESLIVTWGRLRRWIDESREDLAMLAEIGQAAGLWERRGRRDEELWQGDALRDAERAAVRCRTMLSPEVARFLAAGRRRARRQARRLLLRVSGALALLALLAIAATIAALLIAGQKRLALSQRAEAERQGARAAERGRDLLEARARLRASLEIEDSTAARVLFRRLSQDPLLWRRQVAAVLHRVANAPRGGQLAVAGSDRLIYLLDRESGAILRVLRGHADQVLAVAFSQDERRLVSGGWDGVVRLWETGSGRSEAMPGRHQGAVWEARFGPGDRWLATAGADGTVKIWEVASRRLLRTLAGHRAQVHALDLRPDGRLLVSVGQDGTARLWDPETGRALRTLELGEPLHAVRVSPDGALFATGSESGRIELRRLANGERVFTLEGHTAPIWGLAFSPDGSRLASATGGKDCSLRIWDVAARRLHRSFSGHTAMSWVVFVDARRLASSSMDRSVSLWDVERGPVARGEEEGHAGMVVGVSFSPDGTRIASGGLDQQLRIWRTATGEPLGVIAGHTAKIFAVAFSPDGETLASGGLDKTVRLTSLKTGETRLQLAHAEKVFDLAFSPDGATLAVAVQDHRVYLWSTSSGRLVRTFIGHTAPVHGVAFSPDGTRLASAAADRRVIVWEVASGEKLRTLEGHVGEVWGVAFGPGGSLLSAGGDHAAWLWSTREGAGRKLVALPGRLYWPSFHPGGEQVGLPGSDGLARLCDLAGACRELRGHRAEVNAMRFSPDGKLAATTSDDGTLRLWEVARARPAWHAPALLATAAAVELCARDPAPRWFRLAPGTRVPIAKPGEAWRSICERARFAAASPGGATLCSASFEDELELWDLARGARRLTRKVPGLQQLHAREGECLTVARGRLERHRPGRESERLGDGEVTALASDGRTLLVATGSELRRLTPDGAVLSRARVDPGATAIAPVGGSLALGYADGNLELLPSVGRRSQTFEDVPASRVERILPGPRQTLIAGYANGLVGLWSLESGKRLESARLHGPVTHLVVHDRKLHAASELGRALIWDLGDLHLDYCALLRKVWDQIPVVWEGGRAAPRPPPAGHRCLAR